MSIKDLVKRLTTREAAQRSVHDSYQMGLIDLKEYTDAMEKINDMTRDESLTDDIDFMSVIESEEHYPGGYLKADGAKIDSDTLEKLKEEFGSKSPIDRASGGLLDTVAESFGIKRFDDEPDRSLRDRIKERMKAKDNGSSIEGINWIKVEPNDAFWVNGRSYVITTEGPVILGYAALPEELHEEHAVDAIRYATEEITRENFKDLLEKI